MPFVRLVCRWVDNIKRGASKYNINSVDSSCLRWGPVAGCHDQWR